jgi:hypothetical protein
VDNKSIETGRNQRVLVEPYGTGDRPLVALGRMDVLVVWGVGEAVMLIEEENDNNIRMNNNMKINIDLSSGKCDENDDSNADRNDLTRHHS